MSAKPIKLYGIGRYGWSCYFELNFNGTADMHHTDGRGRPALSATLTATANLCIEKATREKTSMAELPPKYQNDLETYFTLKRLLGLCVNEDQQFSNQYDESPVSTPTFHQVTSHYTIFILPTQVIECIYYDIISFICVH